MRMGNHGKLILPAKTVGSIPQALLFLLGIVVLAAVPEGYGVKGKMIVDMILVKVCRDHNLKPISPHFVCQLHTDLVSNVRRDFSGLKALTSLNLSNNSLNDISGIKNLEAITTLNLTNNKLTAFDALLELKTLTSVQLANNEISVLPKYDNSTGVEGEVKYPLSKVTTADFSNNKLANAELKNITTYFAVSSLKTLNISGNDISVINDLTEVYGANVVINKTEEQKNSGEASAEADIDEG